MAKIRIKGDTSGYIDIAAPAVAGTTTLNLPANGSLLTNESVLDSDQIASGAINVDKLNSTLDLSSKTLTLPPKYTTVQETAVTGITSTASVEYTGIPDYVTRITVLLNGVSQGSTDQVGIFVGDATTNGYATGIYNYQDTYVTDNSATASAQKLNANFIAINGFTATTNEFNEIINFVKLGYNNIWQFDFVGNTYGFSQYQLFVSGYVQLPGQLDRVKVAPDSGVLDAGNINILYS